jgi:phytoene dehydrogenase-like protein
LLQSFDPVYEKASAVANDPNWQSSALSIVRLSSHKPMRCTFSFDARFVLDDAYEARKLAVRARYARWRTALQQKLQVADLGNLMPCRERFSWRPPTAAAALAEKAQAAARLASTSSRFASMHR